MGYLLVTAVLVVTLGRLGDMYGRVRIYNAGFAVFTGASVALRSPRFDGQAAALWLIGWRMVQGVGGAMLMANSTAIITDAFPARQRGTALGVNQVAGLAGTFVGLVLGGLLSAWHWRAIFWFSALIGLVGTVWAYRNLRETVPAATASGIDWWGNLTLRRRADRAAGRDHVRHPALRRPRRGLGQPDGLTGPGRRRRPAGRVLLRRDAGRRTRCST